MLITTASVLAALIGGGIIAIGVRGLLAPQAAVDFGIPDSPADDPTFQAWLSVKAVRDIAAGVFVFVLLVVAEPQTLGWIMLAAAGIPIGDGIVVLRSRGSKAAAYGVHWGTAAVMIVIAALLLIG